MAIAVRTLENFIGGEWVAATGETARDVVSPVTGETLAAAPNASREDVSRAAAAARSAQPTWAALSVFERADVMHRVADLVDERREELARALVRPVRWRETVLALQAAGATQFVETGPGRVLTKLVRRIVPEVVAHA